MVGNIMVRCIRPGESNDWQRRHQLLALVEILDARRRFRKEGWAAIFFLDVNSPAGLTGIKRARNPGYLL